MHKKQMSISSLSSCTEVISVADQSLIKGGSGDCPPMQDPGKLVQDVLNKAFNGLTTSTLTPEETGLLTGYLTTLAGTQLGQDILQGIENSGVVNLKFGDTTQQGGANFDINGKQVNISFPDGAEPDGFTFTNVAHELFHVYQEFVGGDASPSFQHEIEAYLFAAMVDQQVDNNNPGVTTDSSFYLNSGALIAGFNTPGLDPAARAQFDAAWNAIISGKDFSAANLNTLINNFTNGGNVSRDAYGKGDFSDANIGNVDETALDDVFPCFNSFSYKNPPAPGGGGGAPAGGGSGSGEDGSDPFDPGSGWLNSSGPPPTPSTSIPSGSYREV